MKKVNMILALHNHQPAGNFPGVFDHAYEQAYRPFMEMVEEHPKIRFALHNSGALWEYFEEKRPEYMESVKKLVRRGQLELLTGAFYESILVMLPERDRLGQIDMMNEYLASAFSAKPRGMWLAERVWEQQLARSLADAGVEYTLLDDTHFRVAGLDPSDLSGAYLTEDHGRTLRVYPISKELRYYIPFQDPEKTIEHLRKFASDKGDSVVVYGDDGEKFGLWPETNKHVYQDGWLERFFKALEDNSDWIECATFSSVADAFPPVSKIFLPDCSYFEMNAWALPARKTLLLEELEKRVVEEEFKPFLRGASWRAFLTKYPEVARLHGNMMHASRLVSEMPADSPEKEKAARALYRGQGNDAYWHGVFGGTYLPHLREAVSASILEALNVARSQLRGDDIAETEIQVGDFDLDGRDELFMGSDTLSCRIKPSLGGGVYSLAASERNADVLNALARRFEAYHDKVANNVQKKGDGAESIHNVVKMKSEGLRDLLVYDWHERLGALDHFFPEFPRPTWFKTAELREEGDFVLGEYDFTVENDDETRAVKLSRSGSVFRGDVRMPVNLVKRFSLDGRGKKLSVEYSIKNDHSEPAELFFGPEWNFAMMAGDSPEVSYFNEKGDALGTMKKEGVIREAYFLGISDNYRKFNVQVTSDKPADYIYCPIKTVSQSEDGFEGIYQCSVVCPVFKISKLEPGASWKARLEVSFETK